MMMVYDHIMSIYSDGWYMIHGGYIMIVVMIYDHILWYIMIPWWYHDGVQPQIYVFPSGAYLNSKPQIRGVCPMELSIVMGVSLLKWLVYVKENPKQKWMMTRGTPMTMETPRWLRNPINHQKDGWNPINSGMFTSVFDGWFGFRWPIHVMLMEFLTLMLNLRWDLPKNSSCLAHEPIGQVHL